jgi:hypothetical protein
MKITRWDYFLGCVIQNPGVSISEAVGYADALELEARKWENTAKCAEIADSLEAETCKRESTSHSDEAIGIELYRLQVGNLNTLVAELRRQLAERDAEIERLKQQLATYNSDELRGAKAERERIADRVAAIGGYYVAEDLATRLRQDRL